MKIVNVNLVTERGAEPGELCIESGKIAKTVSDTQVIDGKGALALPGFIDLHVHGAMGADFNDGTEESLQTITSFFAAHGTTSLLATTSTIPSEEIHRALEAVSGFMQKPCRDHARILGAHLEGPFFHPKALGAQNPAYVQMPSVEAFEKMTGEYGFLVKLIALAPELEGAEDFIRAMRQRGILAAVGHTTADYETAKKAFDAGSTMLTHFFNAMTALKHREPGVIGAAFEQKTLFTQLICDFIHVHPAVLRIAIEQMGTENIVAITDAMSGTGLGDGTYSLGGLDVFVKDGICRIAEGNLAGSTLTMDKAFCNLRSLGYSFADCVRFTSQNAARALGLSHCKGKLLPGYDADVVLMDAEGSVQMTLVDGNVVYQAEK